MSAEWKDVTTYSQGDKERIPSIWELRLTNEIRIVVMRAHRDDPDNWTMHCRPWFDTKSLALPSAAWLLEDAKQRALALVNAKVAGLQVAIKAARTPEGE